MRHDPKSYLWDIQQATQRINSLTAETTFDEHNRDWKVSPLVERLFTIIGEAMDGLAHYAPSTAEKITDIAQTPFHIDPP